jgi:hypothetical protein
LIVVDTNLIAYLLINGEWTQRAASSKCSAYDCEFVALAQDLSVPLVTSDQKILTAFPETAVSPDDFLVEEQQGRG